MIRHMLLVQVQGSYIAIHMVLQRTYLATDTPVCLVDQHIWVQMNLTCNDNSHRKMYHKCVQLPCQLTAASRYSTSGSRCGSEIVT